MKTHTAYFGDLPLGFVKGDDGCVLSVVYSDFVAALRECFADLPDDLTQSILDVASDVSGLNQAHKCSLDNGTDPDQILDAAIALEITNSLASLQEDEEALELVNVGVKAGALMAWMVEAMTQATHILGNDPLPLSDRIARFALSRPDGGPSPFFDGCDQVPLTVNDDFPLPTD